MNTVKKKKKRNFVVFLHWLFCSEVISAAASAEAGEGRVFVFILSFSIRTVLRIVKALHSFLSLWISGFFPLCLPHLLQLYFYEFYLFIYLFAYVSHPACPGYSGMRWRDGHWMREESLHWLLPVRVYNDKNRPALGTWIFNLMRASLFLQQHQQQQRDYDIRSYYKWLTLLRSVMNWNWRLWCVTLKPHNITRKSSLLTAITLCFEHFGIYHLFWHRHEHWARIGVHVCVCERELIVSIAVYRCRTSLFFICLGPMYTVEIPPNLVRTLALASTSPPFPPEHLT